MRFFGELCAEVTHHLFSLRCALSRRSTRGNALALERECIRRVLSRYPYWTRGHLRLGMIELELLEQSPVRRDPRLEAGIRVSTEAVFELTGARRRDLPRKRYMRVVVEAEYLEGRLAFLERRYAQALECFREVLKPPKSWIISESVWDRATEFAGAAALVLGKEAEAEALFRIIPPSRRSDEVRFMLGRFERGV